MRETSKAWVVDAYYELTDSLRLLGHFGLDKGYFPKSINVLRARAGIIENGGGENGLHLLS